MELISNGKCIVEDRNYYRNILVKPNNIKKYYSIGANISFSNSIYKLTTRFYKIVSFRNDIPLDYIYRLLCCKISTDIADIIVKFYLENDVSFHSINEDNGYNTIKLVSNIKYSEQLNRYQRTIEGSSCNQLIIQEIEKIIANNLLILLNNNSNFDINSIFSIINSEFSLSLYKIDNSEIAWGIKF